MNKITKISKRFRYGLIGIAPLWPIWEAYIWYNIHHLPKWIISDDDLRILGDESTNHWLRLKAWLIGVPAEFCWLGMLYLFIKVLKQYEQGEIFTEKNARRYKNIGTLAVLFTITIWLSNVGINMIFGIHKSTSFNILEEVSFDYIMLLLISIGVILVGWVMEAAYQMADEQKQII